MINMNVTLRLFNGVLPNYRDVPYNRLWIGFWRNGVSAWWATELKFCNGWWHHFCIRIAGSVLHELDVMKELSAMHIQMLRLYCHNLYWRLHCQRIWWVLTFQGYAWHNSFGRFLPVLCASQILLITSDLGT